MVDERTYIRVHDGLADHPKIEGLSDKAFRLLIETWCWSSRYLADGRMPLGMWKRRGTPGARRELEDVGLIELDDGDAVMHDYLEHQRSAEAVEEIKQAKRRAGRRGNHQRHHVDKKVFSPECEFCLADAPPEPPKPDPPGFAESVAPASDPRSHMGSQTARKTSPETETETETETDKRSTYVGSARHVPNARELNATATRHGGTALVTRWRDERGVKLTRTTVRALAKHADQLLGDGADPALMPAALDDWAARGKTPAFLRNTYDDQAKAACRQAVTTGSARTDKALGYLDPDDPYREHLASPEPFQPRLIEGGRSA